MTILIIGIFDLFHAGHRTIIHAARQIDQDLIIGLYPDELIVVHRPYPIRRYEERSNDLGNIPYFKMENWIITSEILFRFNITQVITDETKHEDPRFKIPCESGILHTIPRDSITTRKTISTIIYRRREFENLIRRELSKFYDVDLTKSTVDNYIVHNKNPKDPESYTTQYRETRLSVDHNWHPVYQLDRQLTQDRIMQSLMASFDSVSKPSAIFLAGAMGAGKSHFLRMLYRYKLFPLNKYLYIDPDQIKSLLPEEESYVANNPITSSTMLHGESVHIADLLMTYGFFASYNMIIDGTLRDKKFFADLFIKMKKLYPDFRIIVVEVVADKLTVLNRCRKRAFDTGRNIPDEIVMKTWDECQVSAKSLSGFVDNYFHVSTNGEVPKVEGGVVRFVEQFLEEYPKEAAKEIDMGLWPKKF